MQPQITWIGSLPSDPDGPTAQPLPWLGGPSVYTGDTWYQDGSYDLGSPPALALTTDDEDSYVRFESGWLSTSTTRGRWGTFVRSFPFDIPREVPVTTNVYVSWESGYWAEYDNGDGTVWLDAPIDCRFGYAANELPGGWQVAARYTARPLGDRHYLLSSTDTWYSEVINQFQVVPNPPQRPDSTGRYDSVWRIWYWELVVPGGGAWRLRQRQSLAGADSWPLRLRQNAASTGSWGLRQRQTGV